MTARFENGLRASIRSLRTAVSPLVDESDDPLAKEQLRLVISYLEYVSLRIGHAHRRARYELKVYRRLVESVDAAMARGTDPTVTHLLDEADRVLADPRVVATQMETVTARLRTHLSNRLRIDHSGRTNEVRMLVLRESATMVTCERAWFSPQGWEPDPDDVEQLSEILDREVG